MSVGASDSSSAFRLSPDFAPGLVSVIVATYNRPEMLRRAIGSLLAQSYRDLEVVVVDDGSAEPVCESIADLVARPEPPLVRCFRKDNGGAASARNFGLAEAKGEFIGFLDDDDEWSPDAAASLVSAIKTCDAEFVYSPAIEVDDTGATWVNEPVASCAPDKLAREHFLLTNVRSGSTLFKRRVFEGIGGFREDLRHNEDSDFLQRAAVRFSATYSPKPTVRVRNHGGSKSRNRIAIQRALLESGESVLAECPEFAERLGERGRQRIAQIRGDLVIELMETGDFAGAKAAESEGPATLSGGYRASLAVGSLWPARLAASAREFLVRVPRIPGALVRRVRRLMGAR